WGDQEMRWELEPIASGTRLTLWHNIDRRYISMAAAGWHICLDVLDQLLGGTPLGRIVGPDAMQFGWQRLNAEYTSQLAGTEPNLQGKSRGTGASGSGRPTAGGPSRLTSRSP